MRKTPIIFLTWNRLHQFMDCITSFLLGTDPETYEFIICDNGSTQPGMASLLNNLEDFLDRDCKVFQNGANLFHSGWKQGIAYAREKYGPDTRYIISDPDIMLHTGGPSNWLAILNEFLDDHPDVSKVGFALDISCLPKSSRYYRWERKFWRTKYPCDYPAYIANIASTTVLLRHDTYDVPIEGQMFDYQNTNKKYKHPVRIAGRFTARHLGWEMKEKYPQDFAYLDELWEEGNPVDSTAYHHEAGHPTVYTGLHMWPSKYLKGEQSADNSL